MEKLYMHNKGNGVLCRAKKINEDTFSLVAFIKGKEKETSTKPQNCKVELFNQVWTEIEDPEESEETIPETPISLDLNAIYVSKGKDLLPGTKVLIQEVNNTNVRVMVFVEIGEITYDLKFFQENFEEKA